MTSYCKHLNRVRATVKERRTGRPVVMRYYAEKLINDDFIKRFVVLNGNIDPKMHVETECADGTRQRWMRLEGDGKSIFVAPDGYLGGAIVWVHDKSFNVEGMVWESSTVFSIPEP